MVAIVIILLFLVAIAYKLFLAPKIVFKDYSSKIKLVKKIDGLYFSNINTNTNIKIPQHDLVFTWKRRVASYNGSVMSATNRKGLVPDDQLIVTSSSGLPLGCVIFSPFGNDNSIISTDDPKAFLNYVKKYCSYSEIYVEISKYEVNETFPGKIENKCLNVESSLIDKWSREDNNYESDCNTYSRS